MEGGKPAPAPDDGALGCGVGADCVQGMGLRDASSAQPDAKPVRGADGFLGGGAVLPGTILHSLVHPFRAAPARVAMRRAIVSFVRALRSRGVRVSLAESMDAVRAAAAAGVERDVF